jgi:hypothetical protein
MPRFLLISLHLTFLQTFRILNYPCDWQQATKTFYATAMAHWMAEHEVLAAAIFVGLSLGLIAIFAALEHRYKEQLTARRKITSRNQVL